MNAHTLALKISAVVLAVLMVGGITLVLALNSSQDVDKNAQRIDRNAQRIGNLQDAIRISCYVIANSVRLLGVVAPRGPGGPTGQPPRLTDPERLAQLRLRTLHEAMTPAQRRLEKALVARIAVAGGSPIPDCEEVVRHPERVKLLYVPKSAGP